MLSKAYRLDLRHHPEFFSTAFRQHGSFFMLYLKRSDATKQSQAAIIVPKKVDKRAVVRNMIKRRVRATLSALLPHSAGIHVVVMIHRDFAKEDLSLLEKKLSLALSTSRI